MNGSIFCAPLRRRGANVDQRAHAPEAVEPVEHVLRQERRERLDDGAGGGEIARRPLDGGRALGVDGGKPQPASSRRPMRRPLASFAGSTRQSRFSGGRLI